MNSSDLEVICPMFLVQSSVKKSPLIDSTKRLEIWTFRFIHSFRTINTSGSSINFQQEQMEWNFRIIDYWVDPFHFLFPRSCQARNEHCINMIAGVTKSKSYNDNSPLVLHYWRECLANNATTKQFEFDRIVSSHLRTCPTDSSIDSSIRNEASCKTIDNDLVRMALVSCIYMKIYFESKAKKKIG